MAELVLGRVIRAEVHVLRSVCLIAVRPVKPAEFTLQLVVRHRDEELQVSRCEPFDPLQCVCLGLGGFRLLRRAWLLEDADSHSSALVVPVGPLLVRLGEASTVPNSRGGREVLQHERLNAFVGSLMPPGGRLGGVARRHRRDTLLGDACLSDLAEGCHRIEV